MRADNLRRAPGWVTPDLIKRVLDIAAAPPPLPAPVEPVPTPRVKPKLIIVASRDESIKVPDWSEEEDARLRAAYQSGERIDLVAAKLGRSQKAAYSRAKKIGLAHPRAIKGGFITSPTWSAVEDALLTSLYGEIPTGQLPARIGRSKTAIFNRAHRLGLHHGYHRQFTRRELSALKIGFERGLAIADLAAAMGRKAFSLSKYATNHGYSFGRRPLLAAPIDLDGIITLEDLAKPLPPFRVAKSKSMRAVGRIGRYARVQALHEQDEFQLLAAIAFRRGIAAVDLSRAIGRDVGTVLQAIKRLGLKFGKRPPLAEALTRKVLTSLADPLLPLPELRSTRLKRERLEREARTKREKRAAAVHSLTVREATPRPARQAARRAPSPSPRRAPQARAHPNPDRAKTDRANKRRGDAVRRAVLAKAEALLDAGATTAISVHVRMAMRVAKQQRAEAARHSCPTEQAKMILQRRGRVVYSMAVHGGSPDRFFCSGLGQDATAEDIQREAARIRDV